METLSDLVFRIREVSSGSSGLLSFWTGKHQETLSAADFLRSAHSLAVALEGHGLRKGERVAIYSDNRPEWHMVDFACQLLGAVSVSVPADLSPNLVGFVLRNSSSRWVFFDVISRGKTLVALESTLTSSPKLVAFTGEAATPNGMSITRMMGFGAARLGDLPIERYRGRVNGQDPASLVYAEDTTGETDGRPYTHQQMVHRMRECSRILDVTSDDRIVATLPLSRILQRSIDHLCFYRGATLHYVSSSEEVGVALQHHRATMLTAEPAVFEDLYRCEQQLLRKGSPRKRWLHHWALGVGNRYAAASENGSVGPLLALQLWLSRRLFQETRRRLGGHLRRVVIEGSTLDPSTALFFEILDIPLLQV